MRLALWSCVWGTIVFGKGGWEAKEWERETREGKRRKEKGEGGEGRGKGRRGMREEVMGGGGREASIFFKNW